jgi:hypothetical protein
MVMLSENLAFLPGKTCMIRYKLQETSAGYCTLAVPEYGVPNILCPNPSSLALCCFLLLLRQLLLLRLLNVLYFFGNLRSLVP